MDRDNWNSATSNRRRGAFLAGLIILGSGGTIVAGPLPGEPVAIDSSARPVQASPDEAQAAQGTAEPTPFDELNAALAEARAKLDELASAAEIAAVAADLRAELQAAKEENQRLAGELAQTRSTLEAAQTQLNAADAELEEQAEALRQRSAREEALAEAAERSAAQVSSLRDELAAGEDKLAAVEQSHRQTQARMAEIKEALSGALAEAAQLRKQLSDTESALGAAEEERDAARAASEQLRSKTDSLEQSLAAAREQAERLRAERADMEGRLALLQEAADTAAAAARANLVAMEDKIGSLNTALADVRGEERVAEATSEDPPEKGRDDAPDPGPEMQSAGAPAAMLPMPPATTPAASKEVAARNDQDGDQADRDNLESEAPRHDDRRSLARATAALPLEERMQVQALLADLKAARDDRGLVLTVPGGILFRSNSDQVRATAHESLAKVAEVIDIYDGHDVLITGHTDAIGDPSYNETLSERRAALVKGFLVDNFEIDASRLLTRGLGEKEPIASNATRDGRQANRRVEVLVLD